MKRGPLIRFLMSLSCRAFKFGRACPVTDRLCAAPEASMKRNVFYVLMISVLAMLFALPALSQTATVKGVCKDAQGNPIS